MPARVELGALVTLDAAAGATPRAAALLALAGEAEAAGLDALVLARTAACGRDPFVLLGACVPRTARLRLGAALPAGDRPPGVLAKALATLDVVSGGRALLLLVPPPDATTAGLAALGEELSALRLLLSVPAPDFSGVYHHLRQAWNEPRGAGIPPVGLVLAEHTDPAHEAALVGLAGQSADLLVVPERPAAHLEALERALSGACAAAGRLPGAVEVLVRTVPGSPGSPGTPAWGGRLLDLGSGVGAEDALAAAARA